MSQFMRHAGLAGFTFFFVKGLVWIAIALLSGLVLNG